MLSLMLKDFTQVLNYQFCLNFFQKWKGISNLLYKLKLFSNLKLIFYLKLFSYFVYFQSWCQKYCVKFKILLEQIKKFIVFKQKYSLAFSLICRFPTGDKRFIIMNILSKYTLSSFL